MHGVTLDGFIAGITAGFSSQGVEQATISDVDTSLLSAFWFLKSLESQRFETRFHIDLNSRTSRCETGRVGLLRANHSGLVRWSDDQYFFTYPESQLRSFFRSSPVSQAEWELVSNRMLIPSSVQV